MARRSGNQIRVPRLKAPPSFRRGPKPLQAALLGSDRRWPAMPSWFRSQHPLASDPEWLVWWALVYRFGKGEGVDFTYQTPAEGGRNQYGGLVLDFVVPPYAWNVQGVYVHYQRGPQQLARDQLQRVQVAAFGLTMVWLDADQVEDNPVALVGDALHGIDRSRGATRG